MVSRKVDPTKLEKAIKPCIDIRRFSYLEVKATLKVIKKGKSVDKDGIVIEMLQFGGISTIQLLQTFINNPGV